mgnify:CR=1 FL=1
MLNAKEKDGAGGYRLFYVVFTNRAYEIYLVPVPDSIDSDNYPKYKTFDEMLDKSMILGKSLMECLTQIEC